MTPAKKLKRGAVGVIFCKIEKDKNVLKIFRLKDQPQPRTTSSQIKKNISFHLLIAPRALLLNPFSFLKSLAEPIVKRYLNNKKHETEKISSKIERRSGTCMLVRRAKEKCGLNA